MTLVEIVRCLDCWMKTFRRPAGDFSVVGSFPNQIDVISNRKITRAQH